MDKQKRLLVWFCLLSCSAFLTGWLTACRQPEPFDLLITNGTVIDGSGAPGVTADVGVRGGRIAEVGRLERASSDTVIDASGQVVAPGFIDLHTHADGIARTPEAENFVRMGVTSVIGGNCGGSASSIGEALAAIRDAHPAINFGTLVGHNTVRREAMGADQQRAPTADELEKMKTLVATALAEGAFGLSTGLQYIPGAYAETPEIAELAKVVGAAGGLYVSHMRNEGSEIEKSVAEALAIGEAGKCRVHISHLKIDAPGRWGASKDVIEMMDAARKRGLLVGGDQYAYTAASSGLSIRFPAWALEGGSEKTAARLKDEATWKRIKTEMKGLLAERGLQDLSFAVVSSYRADASLNGLSMKEIAAKLRNADDPDAQLELARQMMLAGGASMVYHFMSEDDIAAFMKDPYVSIGSDAGILRPGESRPHPRGYGNNARVLGRYVRELKVILLEEAVRKMTSLPASQFGLADRGLVKKDFVADLVVFDPATVADKATFEEPRQFPVGISHVIVSGVAVMRDGEPTDARPGQVLTRAPGR